MFNNTSLDSTCKCCLLDEKIQIKFIFESIKSCTNNSYNTSMSNIRILIMHKLRVANFFIFLFFIYKKERVHLRVAI